MMTNTWKRQAGRDMGIRTWTIGQDDKTSGKGQADIHTFGKEKLRERHREEDRLTETCGIGQADRDMWNRTG
jgi:hypothetical protein